MVGGVANTKVVDVVGKDASGRILLIMIESRGWGTEDAQATQLKEKINAYAGYILNGSLARKYPETVGCAVDIQLECQETPHGEFAEILAHGATQLQQFGIGLRVKVAGGRLDQ